MSEAVTVWWCEEHGANGDGPLGGGPKPQALHPCCLVAMLAACEDVDLAKPCHMVEVEICAVGAKRPPAEIRAAVVPLLDLEPAVEIVRELIDRIPPPVLDFRDATTWTLAIICAALGLGEEGNGQ